jgi:hypothetical protein
MNCFFMIRPEFTNKRYVSLYKECLNRNFKVKNYSENWSVYKTNNYDKII